MHTRKEIDEAFELYWRFIGDRYVNASFSVDDLLTWFRRYHRDEAYRARLDAMMTEREAREVEIEAMARSFHALLFPHEQMLDARKA